MMPHLPATADGDQWHSFYTEIVYFGGVLVAADGLEDQTAATLLEYFDAPHKWTPEHAKWVELDRPRDEDDANWQAFVDYLAAR